MLISGFTVSGETPVTLLVRAIGPSLAQFGVADALADPQLTLHRATGIHSTNDDWGNSPAAAAIEAAAAGVGAFRLAPGRCPSAEFALRDTVGPVSLSPP